jgi:hypothetical protein
MGSSLSIRFLKPEYINLKTVIFSTKVVVHCASAERLASAKMPLKAYKK